MEAPHPDQVSASERVPIEIGQADDAESQAASFDEQEGETSASRRAELYGGALANKTMLVSADDAALHDVRKPKPKSARYTVMVYMVGSNLESMNGAATDDLGEMLESGVDFSQANVVVYAGGSRRWNTNIPMSCNSVLDLSRAADDRVVAQTASDVSRVGEWETVKLRVGLQPEGVESLGAYAFAFAGGLTDVHVPTSVLRINDRAFDKDAVKSGAMVLHCADGSEAAAVFDRLGIPWTTEAETL